MLLSLRRSRNWTRPVSCADGSRSSQRRQSVAFRSRAGRTHRANRRTVFQTRGASGTESTRPVSGSRPLASLPDLLAWPLMRPLESDERITRRCSRRRAELDEVLDLEARTVQESYPVAV